MGKGKTGRKGDEGKSNGGRGGGWEEEKKKNVLTVLNRYEITLPIEVIRSVDGGGGGLIFGVL